MFKKTVFILSVTLFCINIAAYELPKMDVSEELKPKITFFTAESVVVDNVKKYKLIWKTKNATHVQLTFLGNVKLSDNIIITEQEYQRGPITLTATSTKNSFSDSKTINKFSKAQEEAPIIIKQESNSVTQKFYTPLPYGRRIAPRRLRRY